MTSNTIIHTILERELIKPVFQPIVSLQNGSILAYEALSRVTLKNCPLNIEELFNSASSQGKLWELEKLCRRKALQKAINKPPYTKLFINVDGNIIHDPEQKTGYTTKKLKEYHINEEDIIFEITEQNSIRVDSSDIFIETIEHYRSQNFHIAIDDYGSGYSGLNRVCTFNPDYLKIDMTLIRNIDQDPMKRSAVASTIQFCKDNSIAVIAEGIETEAELNTLIQLGADYGQGYLLGRPEFEFKSIDESIIQRIINYHVRFTSQSIFGQIHQLATRQDVVFAFEPALSIYEKLKNNIFINELFVLDENYHICGILTRNHVLEKFGGRYGYNLSARQKARDMMESQFLAIDAHSSIEDVATLAMDRPMPHTYDAIAITRKGRYIGTVSVKELLLNTIQIQIKYASDASPLTGLPGNSRIQEKIRQIHSSNDPWSIIYLDLDNFKAYNDTYGFGNGDIMIEKLADILKKMTGPDDFCGHVGGDDFVFITPSHDVSAQCNQICELFHNSIRELYSPSDWIRGYIISQTRQGKTEKFPIASLSIACISNKNKQPDTLDELFHVIASTKKKCKQLDGDSYLAV